MPLSMSFHAVRWLVISPFYLSSWLTTELIYSLFSPPYRLNGGKGIFVEYFLEENVDYPINELA